MPISYPAKFKFIETLTIRLDGDNRHFLNVSVKSRKLVGLLDSGANISVLGSNAIELANRLNLPIYTYNNSVKTADGKPHSVMGFVYLPIRFNKVTHVIETLLVPSISSELILGMDFWTAFEIVPVIKNRNIQISTLDSNKINITPAQRKRLDEIITTFLVPTKETPLGRTNVLFHKIDTGTAAPVKQRYYSVSPYIQALIDEELERMIKLGVIERSFSPWSSPVIPVPKPNGKIRICLDSRVLNTKTIKDSYPLPYISRILSQLHESKFISTLDLKDAFWQIPLEESSKEKTAFTIPSRGLWQFRVMPFGLHNAPQTQSRLMDEVLGYDLEPNVHYYIDDLIITSSTFEKHLELLEEVAKRLKKANLRISVDKSQFCVREVPYLGYILNENGLRLDQEKIAPVLNFPPPTTLKGLRSFLGMANWYRRFIGDFAHLVAPLTDLTKGSPGKIKFTPEAHEAFNKVKVALTTTPILAMPDFTKEFQVQSDASDKAVGAVLTQIQNDHEVVIAYMSQKLSPTQEKYSVTEKECLALILAIEKWRGYLEGAPHFTAITDHASLQWLQNLKDPAGRLARWALRLQPYKFTLIHRKGTLNVVPDFLSRCIATLDLNTDDFAGDVEYEDLLENITNDPHLFPKYRITDNKIFKDVSIRKRNSEWKVFVPSQLRCKVLEDKHDSLLAAHQGYSRTLARIKQLYYWPKLYQDVKQYVRRCEVCKSCKPVNQSLKAKMGQPKLPNAPWRTISVDLMGPFPRSRDGCTFLLVIVDVFSKFTLMKPLRNSSTSLICKFIEDSCFLIFGVAETIIHDNGPQFRSKEWKSFCGNYNASHYNNAIYHSQNNPVERYNRTIGAAIRCYIDKNHKTWDKNIKQISCAICTAVNSSTKYTPYYLNFGYEMVTTGLDYKTKDVLDSLKDTNEPVTDTLEKSRKNAVKNMEAAYIRYAKPYNLRARNFSLKEGDKVWRRVFSQSNAAKSFCEKFAMRFQKGVVKEKLGVNCYKIVDENGKEVGVFNAKDLQTGEFE